MIEKMSGQEERTTDISLRTYKSLLDLNSPLFQSVFPILKQLDPQRARAVQLAVERINLIHRESVALVMP